MILLEKEDTSVEMFAASFGLVVAEGDDVARTLGSSEELEIVPLMNPGEELVFGEEARRRARELGANLGLGDLWVLLADQERIPVERGPNGPYGLAFTGTRMHLVNSRGELTDECYIALLYWAEEEYAADYPNKWDVGFLPLRGEWNGFVALARCKQRPG